MQSFVHGIIQPFVGLADIVLDKSWIVCQRGRFAYAGSCRDADGDFLREGRVSLALRDVDGGIFGGSVNYEMFYVCVCLACDTLYGSQDGVFCVVCDGDDANPHIH